MRRSSVFVGRAAELETLRALLLRATSAFAVVEGEAGIGKSRLVREALDGVDRTVLFGQCSEPFPYGAVLDALSGLTSTAERPNQVTGVLRTLLPEITHLLPPEPASVGDRRFDRHRIFRAVRELLASLGPAVLVIEDLHRADDDTRHLVGFLVTDPPPELAVVVTFRREELPGGLGGRRPPESVPRAQIALRPFTIPEVRALIGDEPVFAEALHERTAGIPFAAEEALRWGSDGVPPLLRDEMLERLARLSTTATRVAQAAAVLGVAETAEVIGEVAGLTPQRCRVALTAALAAGVLREADDCRYSFRHSLAQQAVHDTIVGPDRRELHLRALRVLDKREPKPLLRLAEHSRRAGVLTNWMRYGEAAAAQATESGDHATATDLLQRLLEEPELAAADVNRLAVRLGQSAHVGIDQLDPIATLRRLLGDRRLATAVRGEVRLFLGMLLIRQEDDLSAGLAEIELAVRELAERPNLAVKGVAVLAQPFLGSTRLPVLRRWQKQLHEAVIGCVDPELRVSLLASHLPARLHIGEGGGVSALLSALPEDVATPGEQRQLAGALQPRGRVHLHRPLRVGGQPAGQRIAAGQRLRCSVRREHRAGDTGPAGLVHRRVVRTGRPLRAAARRVPRPVPGLQRAVVGARPARGRAR